MQEKDVPLGQRFTQVYIERGEAEADSVRMRARLAAIVSNLKEASSIANAVERRLGLVLGWSGSGRDWRGYFGKAPLGDVLDTVTVAANYLDAGEEALNGPTAPMRRRKAFIAGVRAVFREENVSYDVDDLGGVHRKIDGAFAAAKHAVIGTLGAPRYANALQNLMAGTSALNQTPPDYKIAVRQVFAATEGLFRLMFPRATRLATDQVRTHLRPLVERRHASDRAARSAELELVASFERWVDAAHWYRHESGTEEPHQPPEEVAVNLISLAFSWLRWLASIDPNREQ